MDKTNSDGQSALHCAANSGHAQVVELLLQSGSTVNLQDDDGCTALMGSTNTADTACMLILLNYQADIHLRDYYEGADALMYAAMRNRIQHAQRLLEHGAQIEATGGDGWTALKIAAAWNYDGMAKLLIDKGANVDHQDTEELDTPLLVAAQFGALKSAEVLLENGAALEAKNQDGNTALFEASGANEAEVLKLLIDRGCLMDGKDNNGDTVLLKTVNAGHIECLQILIEAGATPEASHHVWELALLLAARKGNVACLRLLLPKASPDVTNDDGMNGLMLAVSKGHVECARLLLDAKASINSIDSLGRTALHHAAAQNALECTRLLLDRGAHRNCRDQNGRTPLLLLAAKTNSSNAEDCVTALLKAGALVNDVDDKGKTALWLAAHEGDVSVLRALCSHDDLDKDAYDEHGQTVLMFAAVSGKDLRKAEALVASGANLKLQSSLDGRNALAFAFTASNCPAAAMLLQAGSDLSMVVTVTNSSILLKLKEGLDNIRVCRYGEDCLDLVKSNLDMVTTQLEVLKRARDPIVALNPHQKEELVEWAQRARQKIRSRRKYKSVLFAVVDTPELRADGGSQSALEDSSGCESESLSDSKSHS